MTNSPRRPRKHPSAPSSGPMRHVDPEGVPIVRLESLYDGLADNNLGNGIEIPAGKEHQILKMEGRDDCPRVLSISCGYRIVEANEPTLFDVQPVGVLSFGVGGANMEIEFDLLQAMIFNVTATSLNLKVYNNYPNEPGNDPGATIFAQAMIGENGAGRAGANPLRRTLNLGTIAPAAGVLVPVPVGSVAFNVFTTTLGGLGALEVTQSLSPVNTVALTKTQNPQFDLGYGAVPLIGGARGVEVANAGAVPLDVRVMFTLAF